MNAPESDSRIDSIRASELVARFGSPLYVYDADAVRRAYRELIACFAHRPLDCHYAIVCNKNRYLVRVLHECGAGVHANTPGDAHAALAAGVPADHIVYSGTNLAADDLDFFVSRGIRLNLDSLDQLRDLGARGAPLAVGLRLLIDDPGRGNRIGVTPEELGPALAIAGRAGIALVGLHMYAGTNTLSTARFLACLDRLVAASDELPDLAFLDLGGGFGIDYRAADLGLDLAAVGREVSQRMAALAGRRGRPVRLVLEPGRTLVGRAGVLLCTVVSIKERGGRRFVGVDSTVGNIVVPSVYHPHHRVVALGARGPDLDLPTDVCGNTTHSRDFLGRGLRLPALAPGDLIALCDVGAYGYAMSSHFLNRPRPAEVVLDGAEAHLTTRRETLDDLISHQVTGP